MARNCLTSEPLARFDQLPHATGTHWVATWVRLILENSTVCLISRRISLFCPVGIRLWFGVDGFFDNDSDNCQFRFLSGDVALFFLALRGSPVFLWGVVGVGCRFSMESLILAQDERWRRA